MSTFWQVILWGAAIWFALSVLAFMFIWPMLVVAKWADEYDEQHRAEHAGML